MILPISALLTATLLSPYLLMLWQLWLSDSKDSASSALAFGSALVLGWLKRSSLLEGSPGRMGPGLTSLSVATLLYLLSVILGLRLGAGLCAPAILASLLYLVRGGRALRALRVPLLLLLLATPVPGFILTPATFWLLHILVTIVPAILGVLQISVTPEGYVLAGSDWAVRIVEDCSGLGGILLFVPLVFVLLYAHPRVPPMGYATILASALPISFAATVLRIVVTCVLAAIGSPLYEMDFFHDVVGLFSLLTGLVLLALICRRMSRSKRPARSQEAMA